MIQRITIPKDITLSISKNISKSVFLLSNKNGSLLLTIPSFILVSWNKSNRALFLVNKCHTNYNLLTLTYKRIVNVIHGLSRGFNKKLKLVGRGFKYTAHKNTFFLNVGFSHIFKFTTNGPLKISKFSKSEFNLVSLSQQQVNQKSFILQKLKFPDSYKGKGVCSSKPIIIKEGKKKMY